MSMLKLQRLQSLRPLWQVLSPRRRKQLLGLQLLSVVAAAGEVANLGALLPFLRLLANPIEGLKALGPLAAPLRGLPQQHLLLGLGLGFMAVVIASTLLRLLTIRTQLRLAALIAADLGEQVFAAVLQKPFAWHLQHNSSSVLGHLTKDVDSTAISIQALLLVLVNLVIVVLLGGSLIALAPGVMLVISALLAGFYVLVFRFTRGALRADGQLLTTSYQASLQVAQESLGGIRDVLLDRSQPFFLKAYRDLNRSGRLAGAAINIKAQVPRYLIEGFAVILIVGLSLSLAVSGQGVERQLPLLGTLSLGAYRLLQPLQQCFAAFSSLQANQASLHRLEPFLRAGAAPNNGFSPTGFLHSAPAGAPLLQLAQVSFRYSSTGPWVLRDLDLAIRPGERLAFVGSTGSGKSTTSDLILGLLAPSEGQLLVKGLDLHGTPGLVAAWQRRVAHVPQQIYLSDASFAANIAFGVPVEQIDPQRVRQAAGQARIAELIESSTEGYGTVVGERGVRLSGGQRQRIGIARALYRQAELLVLDEATSALDNRTEAEVMEAIDSLDRNITVILIAHRLSTVQRCDRIVLLEQGRIAGLGSYLELESGNAAFKELSRQRDPITS
ncbi:ABC transporter ATP-binding protein [Synechococcus sp. BA-132 BA5]|uniref:ABC transporter ATP-binding protein n=1 Tax=Synechococcus sp. BA-132 BA5 TaxID=3110252 RepID=UPI002B21F904|nr:ABC transporter ATP-binding protein [Synechococcus sp. BA-132 BA5]MEA5413971.1 ABC transporter ATP-binding protein [Synechococcus sp. BA-132 BA5]